MDGWNGEGAGYRCETKKRPRLLPSGTQHAKQTTTRQRILLKHIHSNKYTTMEINSDQLYMGIIRGTLLHQQYLNSRGNIIYQEHEQESLNVELRD